MKLKKRVKKAISVGVASSMLVGMFTFGANVPQVNAQQASGNAPFINSWLVAGPYDSAVADEIYGTVIPENKNVAPSANITASSATFASNPPAFVVDGSTRNQWVTENDNAPWLNFEWETPIKVGAVTIAQWGDGRHVNQYYHLTFTFEDGTTSETIRVDSTSSDSSKPTIFTPSTALTNVVEMKVEIDKGRSPYPSITGVSELEVYEASLSDPADIDRPIDGNWARVASATASSTWKTGAVGFPGGTDSASKIPKFAIDGDKGTEWISQMHDTGGAPSTWPSWDPAPTLNLSWNQPIKVKQIEVFDRHNAAWPANTSDVQQVNYTLKDASNGVLGTGTITDIDPLGKNPGVVTLEQAVNNVSKVELLIVHDGQKNLKNVGLGLTEVNVFDGDGIIDTEDPEPTAYITPKIGEALTSGENNQQWEYFDDRIWNRNYDDYQDLYGYYTVKKGIDTQNKYVYAHTYVYSPNEQNAQFRFGSSSVNRLFVNDIAITKPSVAAEVQKDMSIANIKLKAGWNKILLQIKHSFTEDRNANGVPMAQDANVSYLGFYGRVTDINGNKVDNLTYSVTGDHEALSIATQGLSADDTAQDKELPTNILPKGYSEWPYVWNKSNYTAKHALSASPFQFMASGGEPGYTWTVSEGALPDGLTLNTNGTIEGFVQAAVGTYSFTVEVTDSLNATTTKEFAIEVKDRPNRWFEEGRVSALSHTGPIYQWFVDPNYSIDLWAQRAKAQGHSLVSVEALQQNYYWPSKFADPKHSRNLYMPKDENGKVKDGLKAFEESVKRYGIKFGLYYATEGGGLQHNSTDVFVQNVEDLILRYDPAYLYFDGPQAMPNANYDVMYSNVRNYSDDIIINANAWTVEYGDPDLRTTESSHIYASGGGSNLTKRTIAEPWKSVHTLNNYTPYYEKRDDYRQVAKEMVMNAGRGFVDNNDQMPIMSRGPNWDSPENIATRYPKALQEFIDVREGLAAWFAPEGKPERHESTTGTMPYFLNGFGYTDDGKGNIAKFESGKGPDWGYAMSRDNNIYLHLIEGPDGKKGYNGNSLTISPVKDTVTQVSWLNEDVSLNFTQDGESVTIDLTGVTRDPVDTIVKLVTDHPERKYKLTHLIATGKQMTPDSLQVNVEGYMTYPALKARIEQVTFTSNQPQIASVDANGVVRAIADGTAAITVSGIYQGVEQSDVLEVTVKDGKVYIKDTMIGASLWINDREAYGEFASYDQVDYTLEGRSLKGGAIGLHGATITMKSGIVNLKDGTVYEPISITESDIVTFANGKVVPKPVSEPTRAVIWAEVELDGQTFTSNRVFMDLQPFGNMTKGAVISASGSQGSFTPDKAGDGSLIEGATTDNSKWSVSGNGESWIAFELQHEADLKNVAIHFNTLNQSYYNTPKKMQIQISEDGESWNTISEVTPPTGGAYFGFSTVYAVEGVSKHVRLLFPNGGNSANLDLLEVAINGIAVVEAGYSLTATGASSVIAGDSFDVTYTLSNVAEHVYAMDQTIHYDPAQVEFLSGEALQSGFTIVGQQEGEGEVRILLASSGAGGAIKQTAPVLKLNFKANPVGANVTSSVYVTDATVAGADGIETTVDNGSPHTIEIVVVDKAALQTLIANAQASHDSAAEGTGIGQYPGGSKAILQAAIDLASAVAGQSGATQEQVDGAITQLQAALQAFRDSVNAAVAGDLNGDGKVSLGDLGIIAASYGKKSTDADWAMYEKADMNDDGKIDIVDLAAIARLILG
ncbi:discoidin domain-containing protein [Paenibacillus sp. LHD-117]|uniref:discoidin domain-containing protein n=1 Tax=Paenibacillus sp. LHD-117 TaxID=3071412 RepID=UPI0027DFBC25|nr:discoidin domain-containing protein [Paenibacillus sp. LHD-117]MDQ6421586.1 discoidin domain-containing protein [Paenibacillus sp. LHD-117]